MMMTMKMGWWDWQNVLDTPPCVQRSCSSEPANCTIQSLCLFFTQQSTLKTRSFLLTLSKLSRQHQIHLKHFHITAPNCISHFFLRPHSVAEGVQRHWGTNRALRALGMRCTTEPRRELKHNEQPHLWSSLQKGAESSDEAAHCKPQQHSSRSRWCTRIRSLWALQGHTTPLSSVFVLEHWHINNPASFYALLGIIIIAQMIFLVIVDHPNSWKAYKWAPHNSTKATARKKLNTPLALCFSPTYLHI